MNSYRVEKQDWFEIQDEGTRQTRANTCIEDGRATRKTDILNKEKTRLDVRKNFFTVRVIRKWNQLPENVKAQKTINAFKNSLDEWMEKNIFAIE